MNSLYIFNIIINNEYINKSVYLLILKRNEPKKEYNFILFLF